VWLLRATDTVYLAASIPDSTPYWGDDFVVSLDTAGDAADSPQHDDFQLYFRRTVDSSVIYRGRNGRWEPPRDDPDWRLGKDRSGGGWELIARNERGGWRILLQLHPAWFAGQSGRPARLALRIYDNVPAGWFPWPAPDDAEQPTQIERAPSRWIPVK
jgi:hypothetical protein